MVKLIYHKDTWQDLTNSTCTRGTPWEVHCQRQKLKLQESVLFYVKKPRQSKHQSLTNRCDM